MPYFYGFDNTYLFLVLPCIILSLWASYNVKNTFRRYSEQLSYRRISGAMAAERVLRANGVYGVAIEHISGELTDHYDPSANVIRLSDSVYQSTSIAAIGVACHEAGHAVQYAQNYAPIKIRAGVVSITKIGSRLAMPLVVIGLILAFMETFSFLAIYLGIACFGLSVVLQLVTLPVEFNASHRALRAIEDNELLTPKEQAAARKILTAAALTYLAATALALAQLLRIISIFGRRNKN